MQDQTSFFPEHIDHEIWTNILSFSPCETRLISKETNRAWLKSREHIFEQWKKTRDEYMTQESVIKSEIQKEGMGRLMLQKRWATSEKQGHMMYLVDCHSGVSWRVRNKSDVEMAMSAMKSLASVIFQNSKNVRNRKAAQIHHRHRQ
jgi:O-methyltransferase involved in polyketide biosynthesis